MKSVTLNTGTKMPLVGLGTWKMPPGEVGKAVGYALTEAGYKHIDCAWIYQNEPEIGDVFKNVFDSGPVKREEVFVTSKLWNSFHKRERVVEACKESLLNLKLDYLDLYLMHWGLATPPGPAGVNQMDENGNLVIEKISIQETWEAMQDLVKEGLVKAIGVANFTPPILLDLLSYASVVPAVNQVEVHPYFQQSRLIEFCNYRGIAVTAYSPLGSPAKAQASGLPIITDDPVVVSLAHVHNKTPAQVLLRWGIQHNTVVIPKSTHPECIKENIDVFDFELSLEDMSAIGDLEKNLRFSDPYKWGKVPYFN